jgi:hypothetical protein
MLELLTLAGIRMGGMLAEAAGWVPAVAKALVTRMAKVAAVAGPVAARRTKVPAIALAEVLVTKTKKQQHYCKLLQGKQQH